MAFIVGLGCQASLELDEYTFGAAGAVQAEVASSSGGDSGEASSMSDAAGDVDGAAGGSTVVVIATSDGSVKTCPDDAWLIDDMEDAPVAICPHHGRSSNPWYSFIGSSDASRTVTLTPTPIKYEAIEGARAGSQRALHVLMAALDENDFAGFGFNFVYDRMTLPYDAGSYGGLSLYARGRGSVLVRLTTAETQPRAEGGRCVEEPCYNDHHVVMDLTDEWQPHEYLFTDFLPATYGPSRNFDPKELVGVGISAAFGESEVDIWIDDLRLLPGNH